MATGNMKMYTKLINRDEFLTRAADKSLTTLVGANSRWRARMLPLHLATLNGDRAMFELVMHHRLKVVWSWGPATLYQISLVGIDSVGEGGNDVLEIVSEPDVSPETAALLLDDVFFGLLHKLILKKWDSFGKYARSMHKPLFCRGCPHSCMRALQFLWLSV